MQDIICNVVRESMVSLNLESIQYGPSLKAVLPAHVKPHMGHINRIISQDKPKVN